MPVPFTAAEWEALTAAAALASTEWEQDHPGPEHRRLIAALDRAYAKARQLAPPAVQAATWTRINNR